MCGIAGFLCANENIKSIKITDGNIKSVNSLKLVSDMNKEIKDKISIEVLQWSFDITDNIKYDVIIGADILFFEDYHKELIHTLYSLITKDGIIILLNPSRNNSSTRFIELSKEYFDIETKFDYNNEITQWRITKQNENKEFNIDKDYPLLYIMKLKKL